MKKVLHICLLYTALLLSSCAKDVDEIINPPNDCDNDNISFQDDILSLFNTNCNSCHGASANLGGITLDNYNDVKVVVDAGRLLGAISHDSGFSQMPQNASKLSDCNISKVSVWLDDGAPNN